MSVGNSLRYHKALDTPGTIAVFLTHLNLLLFHSLLEFIDFNNMNNPYIFHNFSKRIQLIYFKAELFAIH